MSIFDIILNVLNDLIRLPALFSKQEISFLSSFVAPLEILFAPIFCLQCS